MWFGSFGRRRWGYGVSIKINNKEEFDSIISLYSRLSWTWCGGEKPYDFTPSRPFPFSIDFCDSFCIYNCEADEISLDEAIQRGEEIIKSGLKELDIGDKVYNSRGEEMQIFAVQRVDHPVANCVYTAVDQDGEVWPTTDTELFEMGYGFYEHDFADRTTKEIVDDICDEGEEEKEKVDGCKKIGLFIPSPLTIEYTDSIEDSIDNFLDSHVAQKMIKMANDLEHIMRTNGVTEVDGIRLRFK